MLYVVTTVLSKNDFIIAEREIIYPSRKSQSTFCHRGDCTFGDVFILLDYIKKLIDGALTGS